MIEITLVMAAMALVFSSISLWVALALITKEEPEERKPMPEDGGDWLAQARFGFPYAPKTDARVGDVLTLKQWQAIKSMPWENEGLTYAWRSRDTPDERRAMHVAIKQLIGTIMAQEEAIHLLNGIQVWADD